MGSTIVRYVQWYSEGLKPRYKKSVANFFGSDGMYWVRFNSIRAAVDEGNEVAEWRIVDSWQWSYNIHMNVGKTGDGFFDLACWRMYMASDFPLLANEAVVAPFFDGALGIGPSEVGQGHSWRWFPVAVAKFVELGEDWITALFGQNRARRHASIASESRGSDVIHLVFHVGIVLTSVVEMKCFVGLQFLVDHGCRWKLLMLMLRLMMCRRLVVEKGSLLQHVLILRFVEFRQCNLLVEKIVETVEGCWCCSGFVEMNRWWVCGSWKQRYGVLQSDVWILELLRR